PGTSGRAYEPEWELFDLAEDPWELRSVHDDPAYAGIRRELEAELAAIQAEIGDKPHVRAGA
ncbi:MAG: DUF4976 domain-containing protein, partial [Nonomuraea sp.]|nr:DUF4976 domain-containing protein [Nonomuraea sp.]